MITELDKSILQKVVTSDKPVSGGYLSRVCHVSVNTIRKEIGIINDYLKEYGCHIDTKIAIGYHFIVDEEELALPFIDQLLRDISRFSYLNLAQRANVYYMARRLLIAARHIPIENFMDELYCSKSTVLRNIDHVREYLESFQIQLKVKRNYGFYLEGSEWLKRMCLIHQHKIVTHTPIEDRTYESAFIATFLINTNYHNEIRNIFLTRLSHYEHISFANIDIPKIINYIILTKTRYQQSSTLQFSEKQIQVTRSLPTYPLAKDVMQHLPTYFNDHLLEQDVDGLSMLLASYQYVQHRQQLCETQYHELRKETDLILQAISSRFQLEEVFDETFYQDFVYFLSSVTVRRLFCILTDEEALGPTNRIGLFTSDLCAQFAYYMDSQKHIKLQPSSLSRAYSIFNRALYENQQFFEKQRLLVVSRYGIYFAKNIAARIRKTFAKNIQEIQCVDFTDLYSFDCSTIDLIVTDINKSSFTPDISTCCPIINVNFYRNHSDLEQLHQYMSHFFKERVLPLFPSHALAKENLNAKDEVYHHFFATLHDFDDYESWHQDCDLRDQYMSFERDKEIVLITNLNLKSSQPLFRVLLNQKSIQWDHQKASVFIYYHQGPGSPKDIQLISYLLQQFLHKPEHFVSSLIELSYPKIIQNFN